MNSVVRDFRYGFRSLGQQPGFAVLAVLALALGIGGATTMFSVIDNVLLNPFPYVEAHRIAAFSIHDVTRGQRGGRSYLSLEQFLEYHRANHVFEDAIGADDNDVIYTAPAGAELYQGAWVTVNTFQFLGVPAMVGRWITPDDIKPGAPPVFVMAYKMWNKRFGQDSSILGQSFILNGVPTTLVGIMPPRFTKRAADVYLPLSLDPADPANKGRYLLMQARMKRGVTLKQVEADLSVIAARLAKLYPEDYPKQFTIQADSYADSVVGQFKATLMTLAAAVGLLLLIACGNVANMLLARASAREKEMAIRGAMGASRWRLIRQLLCESLILAMGGAAVGCLLAYAGIQVLVTLLPDGAIPKEAEIRLNLPVLLFSLGIAVATALLFGLAPTLQASKRDLADPLRDAGKGVSGGFRRAGLRNTLVVLEVGLSLVLLASAGLLMRSFVALTSTDLGFRPQKLLIARVPFPKGQYLTAESKQQFFRALMARLRTLPGVVAASQSTGLPPWGGPRTDLEIPGKTHAERWTAQAEFVTDGFFATIGMKVVRGRVLQEADIEGARHYAVVNETLVRKYFGSDDPLGRTIRFKTFGGLTESPIKDPTFEIVGVVSDTRNQGLEDPPAPEVFVPHTVIGGFQRIVLVRTTGNPLALADPLRREVWAVDRGIALTLVGSLEGFMQLYLFAGPRFAFLLLGVFAGIGLALVAIGVFSVIAYTVSRQMHEIGIRVALGAASGDVLRLVLGMGLRLIGLGTAIGIVAVLAVSRLLVSQLWQISPYDPLTLFVVVVLIVLVGLAASYFPARRATKVDPLIALRYE
jgi:putative ABC transport system permease protein